MMQSRFLLVLGLLLFSGSFIAKAQHYCNLEVQIVAPAGSGTVIENGASRTVQIALINHGPDTFYTTDTMIISGNLLNLAAGTVARGTPSTPMPPGAATVINFSGPLGTILNERTETTDTTIERCISIVTGNLAQPPRPTEVFDTLPDNNQKCVTITFKGVPVTGIAGTGSGEIQSLRLYPNPASHEIGFAIAPETITEVKAIIRDMAGRIIFTKNYGRINAGSTVLKGDVTTLQNGIYLTEVQTNTGKQTGKLIIRH